jgi:serine/threonine protein kinase
MKLCPLCQHCYEDSFISCAHDRSTLIEDRPGACVIAQKYSLERLLVSGAAQAIYAGRHLETDRPYAIILLLMELDADAEALKTFRREALATAQLNTLFDHQHAAKTYDYGLLPDGTVYIITELIIGQSLRQYMDEVGPLPVTTAVRIAQQVADGLEAVHRCGVVHHGLEPANIILLRDYNQQLEAKIINFGFDNLLKQGAVANARGTSSSGQPDESFSAYVAPERRMGQSTDARSDIYSLGVILFEMLAGRLPSGAGAETAVGHDDEAEQLSHAWLHYEMPEPLAQLLTQQLHTRPTARPLRAADVAGRLRAIGDILVSDYTAAQVEDDHAGVASAASEPPIPIPDPTASRLPTPSAGIQPTALPTAGLHEHTPEFKTDDAKVATYVDLNLPQEKSGRLLDEVNVMNTVPAKLAGRVKRPSLLTSIILAALPFGAQSRAGEIVLRAADVMGRKRSLYMIYAITLILSLAGGMWVGSRDSSASLTTTSQAPSAAESAGQTEIVGFAKNSSVTGVDEPFAGDVNTTPGGVENQTPAAKPVTSNEHTARGAAPVDKYERSTDLGASPSAAASTNPHGGKAAIGSYVSAGREPERRKGGGPCRLLVSEHSLSIRAKGGSDTITVSSQNADGTARVTATTKDWPDIVVFPDSRGNSSGPVKYSVISVSKRAGTFAVNFKSPCGMKTVPVTVQQR